jgi:hypothetical protein
VWLSVLLPLTIVLLAGAYCAVALPGCASCHSKPAFVAATKSSPHAKVPCASCHVGPAITDRISFGYRELFGMIVPIAGGDGADLAAVPDPRCVKCHGTIARKVVSSNGIRIAHASCAVGSTCTDCHSTTAHGAATRWVSTYDMETCLKCHVSEASTDCDLCHEGRTRADRVTSGVFATTHGPDWRKTHGMGNTATCTVCHAASSCDKCHGPGLPHDAEFLQTHAEVSRSPQAKCAGCHETAFCTDCHGIQMPHPARFAREHMKPATSDAALCQRCHVKSDCTDCHASHVHPGGAVGSPDGTATGASD